MLVAAAAMAFFACQKQEVNAPEMVKVEGLSFSAEKPEFADASKTEWTGETIQWSEGDKIRVAYTADGVWQNAEGNATADEENGEKTAKIYASNSVEAGETASFSVPGNFTIPTGVDLEFYGVYPSTAASDASMPYAPSVTVTIPAEQKPLANSFDSKGDLMAAKSVSTYILSEENPLPEAIPLMWTRMVAHGHLTLKNLQVEEDEKLQTITLTADENADMVGQYYLYLDTYNVEKASGNNAANSLTVKADNLTIADGGNVTFWTCFLPCTWKSVNVVVETDKATYTREIDLSTNQKTFAQNARNTLAINMAEAERVLRASSALPFERDFSNTEYNQNAITELDGFTIENSVYNAKGAIRLAKTDAGGSVTTLPLDLSQNFHVKVVASGWDDDELTLTVTAGDQSNNLTLVTSGTVDNGPKECAEYIINFQPVSNSASVTFTTEAKKRCYIQKIQVLEGHADLPSTLTVTAPEQMPAEGGSGSFSYILTNPKDGIELTVSEEADWITDVVVAEETVTYTVEANNTADPREADITLTYGDLRETVTVSQKGQTATGTTEWVAKSFADLKAGDEVVIVATKESTSWALSDANGTSDAPEAVNIEYSQDKLTSVPSDEIVWFVGGDANSRIFYADAANGAKWLYCNNSNNGVRVGTNDAKAFTFENDYLKHVGTSRYVGVYTTNPDWRCYTNTTGNITGQTFLFFVKSGEEEPKPAITVSSEASVNVEATGGTGTVSYTLTNAVADAKVSAQANQTWVTIGTITSTSVPFTVSENTGEQRTATITLSYDGAESKTVNITQAAAQSGGGETLAYTVTYTVASTTSVTVSGDAPEGSSATFKNTYTNNKQQMTGGKSQTYTLSGYDGCTITGIKLSMKSNSSSGAGSLSVKAGSTTIASIADSKFNTANWNGAWSDTFVDIQPSVTETLVGTGENIVVVIEATANSLYCQSITITYESTGNAGGGGTVDPEPDPEPSVKTYTLTIDANSFNTTSYAANNNEKTSTATATDGSTMDVKWTSNQVMKQSSAMQWQKSNGYIYNTTDLGTISDISITSSAGTFTKYIGSSQKPTASGSGGYFQIQVGGATGTASKIVITFQK